MPTLRLSQLLLDLYSCPTEQGRWPVVLDQLCRMLDVSSAVIQILLPGDVRLRCRWMVRDSRSEAARALHDRYLSDAVNPRMLVQRPRFSAEEGIFRDSDFFAPNDPRLADLQQRLAATGLGHHISAQVRMSGGEELALVLHRGAESARDFTKREERLALEVMPHLRQAVQLTRALFDTQKQVCYLQDALNSFELGLSICSTDGSSCWMNQAAEHLLVQRGVLWLNSDRQLITRSVKETLRLREMIASAARDESDDPHVLVLRDNSGDALQVRCHALPHEPSVATRDLDAQRRVLVILRDPNSDSSLPPDMLRKLFGLSPAESRLAAALCVGSTLNEYAMQAGVAIGTARYQLKQVMAKTQVSKQSQLVLRLCTSVISGMRN